MNRLKLINIGPISSIDIPISRVNVIIGKQSTGKSTIAKVLSFCMWLEKDIIAHQEKDYVDSDMLRRELLSYHKITNYFNEGAYIYYEGEYISFEYYSPERFNIELSSSFSEAKNGKVAYIPSERILASQTYISSLEMDKSYVRDFLFTWLSIHSKYTKNNAVPIIDVGVKYFYDEEGKRDKIILSNEKVLDIDEASSGIQSIIPLYVYFDYVTRWIFENEEGTSYDKYSVIRKALIKEVMRDADDELLQKALSFPALQKQLQDSLSILRKASKERIINAELDSVTDLIEKLERTHYVNLIVEEPELNLFPRTQVLLLYKMMRDINLSRDKILLTTHSPYTLYALNNCMLGYMVKDIIEKDEIEGLSSKDSWIDGNSVSIWQLTEEGTVQDLKDPTTGLVGRHYFNDVMNETLNEFHTMIDYLDEIWTKR